MHKWAWLIIVIGAGLLIGFFGLRDKGPEGAVTFEYPRALTTKYISAIDWPPQVEVLEEPFDCTEAGVETERAGITERLTYDKREYCVTRVSDAAAGSMYTQYAYAFEKDGKVVVLTFSLRFVQCANFNEDEIPLCESERESFDIEGIVDRMADTLEIT